MEKPLLLLFDGHALMHRAFHALPPLSVSKTGEPTGAVYGFTRMLLKTVHDLKPTHWAITFDRPVPTFRHLEFEEYKAHRPETPDELRRQFGRVHEIVEAFNIPVFELDGYEADDLLGTISRAAASEGMDTIIVSGDNDMLQLVSPGVKVLLPQRTFGETILYDAAAVQQKYGIAPGQVPDHKGLKGDPSDNIPGVLGVGEKTATKLIQLFGSVEGVYEHIDEVTPAKLQETLRAEEDVARQSKRLATIVTDAPVDFDPVSCQVTAVDSTKVGPLFRELEFFRLLDSMPELSESTPGAETGLPQDRQEPILVDSPAALKELVAGFSRASSLVVHLATNTDKLGAVVVSGIAVSLPGEREYYLPVGHGQLDASQQLNLEQTLDYLRPLLTDPHIAKLAHNGKSIMRVVGRHGVELRNLEFDTMIAAHLVGEKSLDVASLARSKLQLEIASPLEWRGQKQRPLIQDDSFQAGRSVSDEAYAVGKLCPVLETELREGELWWLFKEVEMPLVPVLARMESHGIALDTDRLRHMSQRLGKQLLELEEEIYRLAGRRFNINSPKQLGEVLFTEMGLPGGRKTKTGYSTDASVLEALSQVHPVINQVLEYRQLMKLKSTYIDALPLLINPATGRLHTSFNQAATSTGRLSSSDPNLQNIPIRGELGKQVRQAFIASPPGWLISADYSQIELRILAHLSQDQRLLAAFRADEDIHAATAAEVFGVAATEVTPDMRRVAKVVNFGVVYGMSGYGLEQATELSRDEAARFITSYFEKHPGVREYLESTRQQAREQVYVQTLLGRRRYIPELRATNRQVREAAERMAINMPVQGTAADIIKLAMINLQQEMDRRALKSKMLLQVHDELLFESPPEELEEMKALAQRTMSQAMELSVALKVDAKVGRNWGEME
ncbi:MAG: DNA polymerase I [Chloroflexi bacterium]|nr:DNA polymerase I [Chloroflexota bacterium]